MRGDGVCGRDGATGAGLADAEAGGGGAAGDSGTAELGADACATGGAAADGLTGRGGVGIVGGVTTEAGGRTTGGVGTEKVGLTTGCGTTTLGGGGATEAGGGGGAFTVEADGASVGEAAATGRIGGAAVGTCCLRIAFRTSPGREMLDRSILVLISSPSARLGRDGLEAVWASPAARK